MSNPSFQAFSPTVRGRRISALAFPLLAMLTLSACISDGPNQTGGKYLNQNNIILENPVLHEVIDAFPVDTAWTSDVEASHLGDSALLLGKWGNFTGRVRMGFDVVDTNFLDSLGDPNSDSATLKLFLGFPRFHAGSDYLKASVTGVDSLTVTVKAWTRADTGWSKTQRADTLSIYNNRILVKQDTLAALPAPDVIDTLTLPVKTIYAKDSLPYLFLRQLRRHLLTHSSSKTTVYLEIASLKFFPADSTVMLRLGGTLNTPFMPSLVFGKAKQAAGTNIKTQRVDPLVFSLSGVNFRGLNYRLTHPGPQGLILTGKNKGLHMHLNRQALLDTLEKRLKIKASSGGEFDLTYFVPYAVITLPIDTSKLRMEGNFALDMRLSPDLDSLIPPGTGAIPETVVPRDSTEAVAYLRNRTEPGKALDTISVTYLPFPSDSGLRTVIVRIGKDVKTNDTLVLAVGESRDVIRALAGYGSDRLVLSMIAETNGLRLSSYLNAKAFTEATGVRDPKTGELRTDYGSKVAHYVLKDKQKVELRATGGIQRLLNRARAGTNFFMDFFAQPVNLGAVVRDSTITLPFPILAEIPPKTESGRLSVGLDLYLYPLKAQ